MGKRVATGLLRTSVTAMATVTVTAMALAACGSKPAPRPSPSAAPGCTDSAGRLNAVGDGYRVVDGLVAIPDDRVFPVAPSGEKAPAAKLFAKWGLLVRTGQTVEISVKSGAALVGWGAPGVPAASVRITACWEGSQAWTAFAGGTWVAAPACVPIAIRAGGKTEDARLPIGKPCA